jgi:YD repeat-containing protein
MWLAGGIARTLPGGQRETKAYNAAGELIALTDFNGDATRYRYTAAGYLEQIDYPNDADVSYQYNGAGERTQVQDGRGTSTTRYDLRGRMIRSVDADGGIIEYQYDPDQRGQSH